MSALARKFLYRRMRRLRNGWFKSSLTWLACRRLPQLNYSGPSILKQDREQVLNSLRESGIMLFDQKLPADRVQALLRFADQQTVRPDKLSDAGQFSWKTPPAGSRWGQYSLSELIRCRTVMDIANDPGILQVVQEYLGAAPTITDISMWWSYPVQEATENQKFHRDIDDLRFIKLFIYLVDVDEETGPHVYVPSSAASTRLTENRRFTDEEVESTFPGKTLSLCLPQGSYFLEDTYGIHKGFPPRSKNRLCLQVEYALHPSLVTERTPVTVDYDASGYHPHVNRLLISPASTAPATSRAA